MAERPEWKDPAPRPQAVEPGGRYNVSQPDHLHPSTVADLGMGAMDVVHLGLQDDGGDAAPLRALKWGVSAWLGAATTHVVHEYGHISGMSRVGVRRVMLGEVGGASDERQPATISRLFLDGLLPDGGGAISMSEDDWAEFQERFAGRPEAYNRFWLSVEAGGLNQEQVLASRYATRLHEGRLSHLDTTSYLWASCGTLLYPANVEESDIADYVELLEAEGRSTSASRLKLLSAARFAGGAGIASVRGAATGLFGRAGGFVEPLALEPLEDVRVFWPELESYLTHAGPTLKANLPVRPAGFTLLPSYERTFAGGGADDEVGLRARTPFIAGLLALEVGGYANGRGGAWRSAEAELRPLPFLSVLVGLEGGTGYTFRREIFGARDEFVEGSEKSLLLGLRLALSF